MKKIPELQWMQGFRKRLDQAGYQSEGLRELLGSSNPPPPSEMPHAMHLTRAITPLNTYLRLFLLGQSVDATAARETLSDQFVDNCVKFGLLATADDRLYANIVIVPVDDLLFASDAFRKLGTPEAADFVLPASTHSADILRRVTMRGDVDRCLDLGCGCGIHALCAARHSERVVASDISAAAIQYTAFNAMLNGISNVECVAGSLFEPVAGERFDLIICNPPFVIGPGQQFVYRDNEMELDQFCREIVRQASDHLVEGGHLQMLCEWVEVVGELWSDRVSEWVRDTQCDAWILRSAALTPVQYVSQRTSDLIGEGMQGDAAYDEWLQYFEQNAVQAVDPGIIVLRRRSDDNWVHLHSISGDLGDNAGDAIVDSIAACDFLDLCKDDDSLAKAALAISPRVRLEQQFSRAGDGWQPLTATLRREGSLPAAAEVDLPILAFLNQLDGKKTLGKSIEAFSASVGADARELTKQLLPPVRLLVGRGLLVAADLDASA